MMRLVDAWIQRPGVGFCRIASALLAACGALAVVGCEAVPTAAPPPPAVTAPGAAAPDRPQPEPAAQAGPAARPGQAVQPGPPGQAGQGGQAGQTGQGGQAGDAGQVAAQPDRSVALLATRQLRCAVPGPPGQDPERASVDGFQDEAQWRAHLASVDPGTRAALQSFGIDFKAGQSAALVRPGALPNLGYRISIPRKSLPVSAGILAVQMVVEPPPPHLLQAQVIAFPCIYLRLADSGYDRISVDVERRPAP